MAASCFHSLSGSRPGLCQIASRPQPLAVLRPRKGVLRQSRRLQPSAYFTVRGPSPNKGSKQNFICKDCGYIYEGRESFESLTKDYECPVCAAPKRRFKEYTKPTERNANATANRQARKAQLNSGPDATQLVIFLLVGAVFVVGLYALLNATY